MATTSSGQIRPSGGDQQQQKSSKNNLNYVDTLVFPNPDGFNLILVQQHLAKNQTLLLFCLNTNANIDRDSFEAMKIPGYTLSR